MLTTVSVNAATPTSILLLEILMLMPCRNSALVVSDAVVPFVYLFPLSAAGLVY